MAGRFINLTVFHLLDTIFHLDNAMYGIIPKVNRHTIKNYYV